MANNFQLLQSGEWLEASGERLLNEEPRIYAVALNLIKHIPSYEATEYGYTRFVVHIMPGRNAFLHPGPHNGRSNFERSYLILEQPGVMLKPEYSRASASVPLINATVRTAGRKLREFMVDAMANPPTSVNRARNVAPNVAANGATAALVEMLRLQLQEKARLERRVRELEARVEREAVAGEPAARPASP